MFATMQKMELYRSGRAALLGLLGILLTLPALATHNRAGEIIYRNTSYLSYEVTIITYTKTQSQQADRDSLTINWGDGTSTVAGRVNGPIVGGNHQGEEISQLDGGIKMNRYTATHAYAGPLPFYVVSVTDPNRISDIININSGSSVNVPFYLEDTLRIYDPSFFGLNSSPELLYPPIDFGNVNDTFYHNPAAFDIDGDSLSFSLIPPLQAQGFPVPNYEDPDEISPGVDNNFNINPVTGEIIWAVPKQVGIYNIAILVTEWRNGVKMGTMIRDMQIFIRDENNDPPQIAELKDTCVVAGSELLLNVTATDPNASQEVTLSASGGPLFLSNSPASFSAGSPDNPVSGLFSWQTNCDHIRKQFYQVVFKAEDNYVTGTNQPIPLVDLETWLIEVVGPPPENLQAQAISDDIELTWDNPYACATTDKFIGFSIWRREGSNPFPVDTCETGLAGRGYTKIAENVTDYTYTDTDLSRGKLYCYRILADFADESPVGLFYNRVSSLPSNEACDELRRDIPVLTHADVEVTDPASGRVFVAWVKPIADTANLDTTQFPGPYRFDLYRSPGFTVDQPRTQLASYSSPNFGSLNDTSYTDTLLNTVDNPYAYELEFYYNGGDLLDTTDAASTIYLSLAPQDQQLDLSWEANVPWVNEQYVVYKQNALGTFDVLDTTTVPMYSDTGLINDSTYCYYVLGIGSYSASGLPEPLLNRSQRTCAQPMDTVAPCPPVLTVTNNCDLVDEEDNLCEQDVSAFKNDLSWTTPLTECGDDDTRKYNVYFRSPVADNFVLVDSLLSSADTAFQHIQDNSLAGCYAITAVDYAGNESDFSNIVCVDNCPCYVLPNVFSPNGDDRNDIFTPIMPYRFVESVDMKIYDRWGVLVFETTDPNINWDGTARETGNPVKEGVYFYTCIVNEIRQEGIIESPEVRQGYIHVIRGNGETN